jgi:hypothetical protein
MVFLTGRMVVVVVVVPQGLSPKWEAQGTSNFEYIPKHAIPQLEK